MEVFAACHVHSDWSYDGSWTLEALRDKFRQRGHRAVLMTEHDRGFTAARFREYRTACAKASSEALLLVPGIEYSDASNRVHVLVWGAPFLGEGLPTGEMLARAQAAGGVAVLAHPCRKQAWQGFQPEWSAKLLGVEVWNRKYDGWAPSKTPTLRQVNAVPFVGLDFHTVRQSFPLAMALDIAGEVSEETILECLKARRCSARAFGVPLGKRPLRALIPALNVAERSRRKAAAIVRQTKAFAR